MPETHENNNAQGPLRRAGPALSFGTTFAAGMLVFTLAGVALDRRLGTDKRYTLIGILLGLLYGGYELWKIVRELNRVEKDPSTNHEKH